MKICEKCGKAPAIVYVSMNKSAVLSSYSIISNGFCETCGLDFVHHGAPCGQLLISAEFRPGEAHTLIKRSYKIIGLEEDKNLAEIESVSEGSSNERPTVHRVRLDVLPLSVRQLGITFAVTGNPLELKMIEESAG